MLPLGGGEWPLVAPRATEATKLLYITPFPRHLSGFRYQGPRSPPAWKTSRRTGGGAAEGCAQMTSDLEPRDRQPTGRGVCAGGMIYLGISFSISGRVCLPRSSHPPASVLVASRGHFMRPSHPLREEEVVVSVSTDEETET